MQVPVPVDDAAVVDATVLLPVEVGLPTVVVLVPLVAFDVVNPVEVLDFDDVAPPAPDVVARGS